MGGTNSKNKKSKKGRSDDACIGNRKVRTIILALLIGLFFVLACPIVEFWADFYKELEDVALGLGEPVCVAIAGGDLDVECSDFVSAWWFIFAGAIISIVGCILAAILFLIPSQENVLGRVAGFILIVGGICYLGGWIWYIVLLRPPDDVYDLYTDEAKQDLDARLTGYFGEALLAAGSAILLGLDAMIHLYDNEGYRLSSNLGIIMAVAILCINAYFLQICDEDDSLCFQRDGVEAIATGYLVLFWVCLVYIILYICTCCTCDCKDKCLVRLIIAVILVIGGLLTAIGYWVYVGADESLDDGGSGVDTDTYEGKNIVYYIGYTILIGGLACVWALDMAFDDVKNR